MGNRDEAINRIIEYLVFVDGSQIADFVGVGQIASLNLSPSNLPPDRIGMLRYQGRLLPREASPFEGNEGGECNLSYTRFCAKLMEAVSFS